MILKQAGLPEHIIAIIKDKATEKPFSGEYHDFAEKGSYLCRQCGLALFRSQTKFYSGCGWASFDGELNNAIEHQADSDGMRTEIICKRCHAHLGHVFGGEGLTPQNIRHCVNSLSLDFVADELVEDSEEAIFAGGCFWGLEYYFQHTAGVLKTEVGYIGGHKSYPTYQEVCSGNTGHYEALRVVYDPNKVDFAALTKLFFEIHDPTQADGQGPDRGQQYFSALFYYNEEQKKIALAAIDILSHLGYQVVTRLLAVSPFYRAEKDHQQYYQKSGKVPYCHRYEKKW
jgi:peptide methionine sulfoxide reductase msrA/msrB